MYQAGDPAQGRAVAERVIDSAPSCPIPDVARLGRTLRQRRSHVLARFDTHRIGNGGTEAVNLISEKTRRLAHGFAPSSTTAYASCLPPAAAAPTDEPIPKPEEPLNAWYSIKP